MSKSIPLSSTLSVKLIFVIISDSFDQWLDFVLEWFSIECWGVWNIQGEIQWDDLPSLDLFRGSGNPSGSE